MHVEGVELKFLGVRWISWARRYQILSSVELARKIVKHRPAIDGALDHDLPHALEESTNTPKIPC